jgi:diguanylate cyclase (GGDEF)-like protein
MRILIADDSAVSRKVLERMLTAWGYDVISCKDGDEAWQVLQEPDAPRIAILDWVMPGLDGIDICRRLRDREDERHVFVYLLTARDSSEDMLVALDAGADDYLTKPMCAPELRVRLRNGRRLVELHEELISAREALRTQAMIDPLTQVGNRRAFMDIAIKELARACRSERPLAVVMIDLDHFKAINDTHGHAVGDHVLAQTARRLSSVLRASDHLARCGGEEFVVLLPECDARNAFTVGERLRREVSRRPIETHVGPISVTASVGVAVVRDGSGTLATLLERADKALYRAKRSGRDKTVLSNNEDRSESVAAAKLPL